MALLRSSIKGARFLPYSITWPRSSARVAAACVNPRPGFSSFPVCSIAMEVGTCKDSLSKCLWNRSRKQAMFALYHPFVVALAAGTLKIEAFRHYIAQDAFFLQAFAKAYGLAFQNADDDHAKLSISKLQRDVYEELQLHASVAEAWGVNVTEESNPDAATEMYTNFLLTTAASLTKDVGSATLLEKRKQAAFTIGAMVPCMRLYAFLGHVIAKNVITNDIHFLYQGWVDTYSSENFEASASQIEQLLDNLALSLSDADIKNLERLYFQALAFEVEFFSARPHLQSTYIPFIKKQESCDYHYLFISDFDSTCSIADSCPALAEVSITTAIEKEQEHRGEPSQLHVFSSKLRKQWELLEKSYASDCNNLLEKIIPTKAGGPCQPYDCGGLRVALESLSQFEVQANLKVVQAGVLRGLDIEEVENAGSHMALQGGCGDLLKRLLVDSNVELHVISVCWSKTFVQSSLLNGGIPFINVVANELEFVGGLSTGDIVQVVETPLDKEKMFDAILESTKKSRTKQVKTIFIGDSVTDLLCLLKADIGIVVGSSSTLRRVTDAFGIKLIPLYRSVLECEIALSKNLQGVTLSGGVLFTATDWYEIHAFLLGPP